jgi:hypothetical protein
MIGITFVKQNSAADLRVIFADSSTNDNTLTPMERFKTFLIRLNNAKNLTIHSLCYRWSYIFNYPKIRTYLSNNESLIEEKVFDNSIASDKQKISMGINKIPGHELTYNLENQVTLEPKQLPSDERVMNFPPSKPVVGRSDPFLTLGEKFQTAAKPKVQANPKIKEQPKIIDKPKVELKPPLELYPKITELPKIVKEEETPSAKILRTYHLRGVVIGDTPIAYVEDQYGYHKVKIGDTWAEGKIIDITATSLTIQTDSEQVVMKMEGLK